MRGGRAGEPPDDRRSLSELLTAAAASGAERITLGELVERLSTRGLAPLVLLMGIINVVTIVPGSSTVLGLPLVFLGLALAVGAGSLWLPAALRRRSFDRATLAGAIDRALPYLRRVERLARPRLWVGLPGLTDRLYGLIVLLLGLMVALPVPFGNTMPGIAIILLSLGFTARDGLWVAAGLLAMAVALAVVLGAGAAIGFAGASLFGH